MGRSVQNAYVLPLNGLRKKLHAFVLFTIQSYVNLGD